MTDVNDDKVLEASEFNEFMIHAMNSANMSPTVIEAARQQGAAVWSDIFQGMDLTGESTLTWPDIWEKLEPVQRALPPLGGFTMKKKVEESSESSDEQELGQRGRE